MFRIHQQYRILETTKRYRKDTPAMLIKYSSHVLTRQSEMADLARRATSVCTKFHRDRLRND